MLADRPCNEAGICDLWPKGDEWSVMDPGALVDHPESTHHTHLHDVLPRVCSPADKVAAPLGIGAGPTWRGGPG